MAIIYDENTTQLLDERGFSVLDELLSAPSSVWQPTSGNGEMRQQGTIYLITLSGAFLVTLSGNNLILDNSTYSIIPPTIWEENDSI